MEKLLTWLDGKKTYIGVVAGALYSAGIYFGVVPSNELVWTFIATWTGVSFRLAQSK